MSLGPSEDGSGVAIIVNLLITFCMSVMLGMLIGYWYWGGFEGWTR